MINCPGMAPLEGAQTPKMGEMNFRGSLFLGLIFTLL